MRALPLTALLAALGCADVSGIENRRSYGPGVALIDLFTTCFLVKTSAGPVLVDACWRPEELRARLTENGVKPEEVGLVLLTHGHQDHVGGLPLLPNARLAALAAEQEELTKQVTGDPAIDEVLQDGQALAVGTTEVRVYAVPGHTPGSAAFLIDGALFLGDNALVTAKGTLAQVPRDRSADPERAIRSLVALADRLQAEGRAVRWLVPAHSGGLDGDAQLRAYAEANR